MIAVATLAFMADVLTVSICSLVTALAPIGLEPFVRESSMSVPVKDARSPSHKFASRHLLIIPQLYVSRSTPLSL